MELDLLRTAAAFVGLVAVGVGGLLVGEVMAPRIVLMMVLPSMVAFGLLCLLLGIWHGRHRAMSP